MFSFPQVDESLCLGSRPESELPCTSNNCPSWYAGAWSGVSYTMSLTFVKLTVKLFPIYHS